jgi:hypothetical protein
VNYSRYSLKNHPHPSTPTGHFILRFGITPFVADSSALVISIFTSFGAQLFDRQHQRQPYCALMLPYKAQNTPSPTFRVQQSLKSKRPLTNLFLLVCALRVSDVQSSVHAADHAPAKPRELTGSAQEIPVDGAYLGSAIGVFLRHLEVRYPRNLKLSAFHRIYNRGVLDKVRSSIQVHATTMPTSQAFIDLGFLDPDTLTGTETRRMKVFGNVGPYWIEISKELSKGGSIIANPTENLSVGREYPLCDMSVGLPPFPGGEQPEMRVTIHVRLDRLSAEEEKHLRQYPKYNAAFKLDY